ncbi:hypothetical protein [Reyranella soli]|jgi:hypothetical protein|uniref:Uncharacterized protein n=1 Tax=Reyranella soli TaxID=1230389 RepID=A0A512N228_9HYPH|nr:hypothetical protein [Reyranella soli]GEP53036.1 hypothetical protein RSO01_02020 [Reyranella soli]
MPDPRYPARYQINTRVWLTELSRTLGRRGTLDDLPDAELDRRGSGSAGSGSAASGKRAGGAGGLARASRVAL